MSTNIESQRPFQCPFCQDPKPITPAYYEDHCLVKHGVDPTQYCVWCMMCKNLVVVGGGEIDDPHNKSLCRSEFLKETYETVRLQKEIDDQAFQEITLGTRWFRVTIRDLALEPFMLFLANNRHRYEIRWFSYSDGGPYCRRCFGGGGCGGGGGGGGLERYGNPGFACHVHWILAIEPPERMDEFKTEAISYFSSSNNNNKMGIKGGKDVESIPLETLDYKTLWIDEPILGNDLDLVEALRFVMDDGPLKCCTTTATTETTNTGPSSFFENRCDLRYAEMENVRNWIRENFNKILDDDDDVYKLEQRPTPFPCPFCLKTVIPETYERHCSLQHGIKAYCVWCLKNHNDDIQDDDDESSNCRSQFMYTYHSIVKGEKELNSYVRRYRVSTTNDDDPLQQQQQQKWRWYHVTVNNVAKDAFDQWIKTHETQDQDQDQEDPRMMIKRLPICKWCTGSKFQSFGTPDYLIHSHWILLSSSSSSSSTSNDVSEWNEIRVPGIVDSLTSPRFQCIRFEPIQNEDQLLRILRFMKWNM